MVEDLIIEKSDWTPSIACAIDSSTNDGVIEMNGRCINLSADAFFQNVNQWINAYCLNPCPKTDVQLMIEYINGFNCKFILTLLQKIVRISLGGRIVTISWFYENGDDDMKEIGEVLSQSLNFEFTFIMKNKIW